MCRAGGPRVCGRGPELPEESTAGRQEEEAITEGGEAERKRTMTLGHEGLWGFTS